MIQIFLGNSALFSLLVKENGTPLNIFGTTRAIFVVGGVVVDSQASPAAFDWITRGSIGILAVDLTGVDIPIGQYGATLILYDSTYPSGRVASTNIAVQVDKVL